MAKKKISAAGDSGSRHGKVPIGWAQQTLLVPEDFQRAFREEAGRWGQTSVKLLGTIAMGMLLGLPADARREFYFWILRALHDPDETVTPERIFSTMMEKLSSLGFIRDHLVDERSDNIRRPRWVGWEVTRSEKDELTVQGAEVLKRRGGNARFFESERQGD